jgi:hypothetical protein
MVFYRRDEDFLHIKLNKLQTAISAVLVVSALVGTIILKTDGYLWAAAPSHAYGLVVFVVVDLALAAIVWRATRLALLGSALLGAVQFTAMAGDVFVGQPTGLPTSLWEQYLLGDTYFVALLCIQLALVAAAVVGLAYRRSVNSAAFKGLER